MGIESRKAQLEARLAELNRRVGELEDELDDPVSDEPEEQAIDIQQDEVREDLGEVAVQEIRMIEAALDRIANGRYGICVNCGEKISVARLDALPATPLCADCAAGA
jgi:RNA polymerase-binding transcription factor DksA